MEQDPALNGSMAKRPESGTEEVRLEMESPANHEASDREVDNRNSRKSLEPLPLPPEAVQQAEHHPSPPSDDDADEDEDEAPYDYARVGGQEDGDVELSDNDSRDSEEEGEEGKGRPGRYAKVTRHSYTDYEPMPDVPRQLPLPGRREKRDRSVTDPVDPGSVKQTKPRSLSTGTESASALPLPAVPPLKLNEEEEEEVEDDMYDSIKDDVKMALRKATSKNPAQQKVYEAVDEENDMYECVSEEVKESVHQLMPALPTSPVPKTQQKVPSNSPSPVKQPSSPLDKQKKPSKKPSSKEAAKEAKKEGKKRRLEVQASAPVDGEGKGRHFSFIFSRKKSSSVYKSQPDSKQEMKAYNSQEHLSSPVHKPFSSVPLPSIPPPSGPPPAVPVSYPVSVPGDDDDEDEGGMYDSVKRPVVHEQQLSSSPRKTAFTPEEAKLRSSSLPLSARGAGASLFNPHLNEPLPDVPEDSGSGSGGASVVRHPRQIEMCDPNYDTVEVTRRQDPPEVIDPNYDTVQLPQRSRQQQPASVRTSNVRTASGTSSPPATADLDESVEHDEEGYAVVDPKVVLKKRESSLSVVAAQESMEEPGYEKVKKMKPAMDDAAPLQEEPGYDSVKKPEEDEEEGGDYDSLQPLGGEESPQQKEPGYATITKPAKSAASIEMPSLALQKQEEPGYDRVRQPGEQNEPVAAEHPSEKKDEMYSRVDLAKKQKTAGAREGELDSLTTATEEQERTSSPASPAPPVPVQGDLGDLSEFQPPPIPEPQYDLSDEASNDTEPPDSTVKPGGEEEEQAIDTVPAGEQVLAQGTEEVLDNTSMTTGPSNSCPMAVDPPKLNAANNYHANRTDRASSSSSTASSGSQQLLYDSLAPLQAPPAQPTYDSLASVERPSQQIVYDRLLSEKEKRPNVTYEEVDDMLRERVESMSRANGSPNHVM